MDNVVAANLLAAGLGEASTGTAALEEAAATDSEAGEVRANAAEVVNIACGERYTLLELVAAINRVLGTDIEPTHGPPRPGDVLHSQASIERARKLLGYTPGVGFDEGLQRTVSWFENGQRSQS